MTRLIDADKLKEKLQKHHDFFIEAWKENGVDKIEIPIPDKSRMNEITNCIAMVVNAPTFEITEEQAIDKLHETGWLIEHDKEMTERPHGKWIYIKKEDKQKGYGGYCSICKCDMPIGIEDWKQKYYESNFCPNCGADMR